MGTVGELIDRHFQERAVRFDALPGLDDTDLAALPGVTSVKHDDERDLCCTRGRAG